MPRLALLLAGEQQLDAHEHVDGFAQRRLDLGEGHVLELQPLAEAGRHHLGEAIGDGGLQREAPDETAAEAVAERGRHLHGER